MKRRSRSPPPPLPEAAAWTMNVARRHSIATPSPTKQPRASATVPSPSRGRPHHPRRASLSSGEFDVKRWRATGDTVALGSTAYTTTPYPEQHHTPESDTADCIPDCAPVPPRRSSLAHHESVILGLSSLSLTTSKDAATDGLTKTIIYESDHHLPPDIDHHHLPPADSMLLMAGDAASFISESSQFSPSGTSKSLPSTKTSLSRSARSGREGSGDIEVELGPKATGPESKVQLDKRRMILLEIVETEVTYVRDLRALVHIYLPQLAALPRVSERIHQLIVRNTAELLDFHIGLVGHMVDILKFSGLNYESSDAVTIDTATKGLADLFVSEGTSFALYNDYCAGSTAAAALVRTIAHRSDYEAFEKRCQIISSSAPHATLLDILTSQPSTTLGSRLRFRDMLITPVQRVCRYPLLLASLLADVNRDQPMSDVVAAVEAAQVSMRAVAENADDARRRKEAELKTATVAERIETHPVLTREFLTRLGTCRLIGALDVLYHHHLRASLDPPVKVRYLAAFLYRGYIVLAKVQKTRGTFEPKHYLPLEVFELADIKKGEKSSSQGRR
ncbi:hypothetical protein Q8F55_008984 [Vanrija albida]|uniref:DH domain-containing protein n=1 Tax=Vanrija albida TaxID=181172 RepID=A0ABR3PSD8_9TREE